MCSGDIFLAVLAIFFPPIAVWIKSGLCSADSIINILLCVLGYLPGLLHAWYIISLYPEPEYEYHSLPDSESQPQHGRVTYYYINHRPSNEGLRSQQPLAGSQHSSNAPAPPRQYGTLAPGQQEQQSEGQAGSTTHEDGVPPSYEQAIKGDNKLQT